MTNKVRVIEIQSGEILFQCSMDESEKAYQYASDMEAIGLDVTVQAPSTMETLAHELGISRAEIQDKLVASMDEEIDSHNDDVDSCCFKN
ncbi:MAG: hypothetical protein H6621_11360 [Halobacteriovoraceae bacterium]|nr:hypothetical protein [Halobacteriovoraceae bacterium]MCB9095657.1 hypothetical protein [Halobacteriovoraceae bacterium]